MNNIIVKSTVDHQDIGGKNIDIEFRVDMFDVCYAGMQGNMACKNFVDRKGASGICVKYHEVFYGKVGNLGYIVAEDDLVNPEDIGDIPKKSFI